MFGDADPVEAELIGHGSVAEPSLKAFLRDIWIAGIRQDAGPVNGGVSVMSTTQKRSFHWKQFTVLEG
jgi:hypothetical protein